MHYASNNEYSSNNQFNCVSYLSEIYYAIKIKLDILGLEGT